MYEKFSRKFPCTKNSVESLYIYKKVSCVQKIQYKVSMYEKFSRKSLMYKKFSRKFLCTKNLVESLYV